MTIAHRNLRPKSLQEVAACGLQRRSDLDALIREFLDEFYVAEQHTRRSMVDDEPALFEADDKANAYLAAVAEHLTMTYSLAPLEWVRKPERFLRRPFFPAGLESLKAICLRDSPTAFRRRMIFVDGNPLSRPRQHSKDFTP